MNTKLHSKLKRTLAWIMAVSMMVQGVSVVSAEDFSSEPDVAVVSRKPQISILRQMLLL